MSFERELFRFWWFLNFENWFTPKKFTCDASFVLNRIQFWNWQTLSEVQYLSRFALISVNQCKTCIAIPNPHTGLPKGWRNSWTALSEFDFHDLDGSIIGPNILDLVLSEDDKDKIKYCKRLELFPGVMSNHRPVEFTIDCSKVESDNDEIVSGLAAGVQQLPYFPN